MKIPMTAGLAALGLAATAIVLVACSGRNDADPDKAPGYVDLASGAGSQAAAGAQLLADMPLHEMRNIMGDKSRAAARAIAQDGHRFDILRDATTESHDYRTYAEAELASLHTKEAYEGAPVDFVITAEGSLFRATALTVDAGDRPELAALRQTGAWPYALGRMGETGIEFTSDQVYSIVHAGEKVYRNPVLVARHDKAFDSVVDANVAKDIVEGRGVSVDSLVQPLFERYDANNDDAIDKATEGIWEQSETTPYPEFHRWSVEQLIDLADGATAPGQLTIDGVARYFETFDADKDTVLRPDELATLAGKVGIADGEYGSTSLIDVVQRPLPKVLDAAHYNANRRSSSNQPYRSSYTPSFNPYAVPGAGGLVFDNNDLAFDNNDLTLDNNGFVVDLGTP